MEDRNILKIETLPGKAFTPDNIGIECKGNPVDLVRAVCLAMERYEAIRVCILSAAENYCIEHNMKIPVV